VLSAEIGPSVAFFFSFFFFFSRWVLFCVFVVISVCLCIVQQCVCVLYNSVKRVAVLTKEH